jgi:hypothetical protein
MKVIRCIRDVYKNFMEQRAILLFAFNKIKFKYMKCFMIRVSLEGRVKVAVQILTTVCPVSIATDCSMGDRVSIPSRVFFLLATTSSSSPSLLSNGRLDSLPVIDKTDGERTEGIHASGL